jgi:hypothetical protein
MIPEFITAKPSTNRNASDALSAPDTTSADQLQNKAAFQKALHERTSERPADQSASSADEVRPEKLRQPTPPQRTNEAGRQEVSQDTSKTAENQKPRSGLDSAQSTATDTTRTDANRESEARGQHDGTEAASASPDSSKLIRRIDPANHSTSIDAATRPSENAVESGEISKLTSDVTLPSFVSTDDSDISTLPSLIRLPQDDLSISQNVLDIDPELRPFLNDALVPDAESAATNSRFTATESALIAGVLQSSPAADVISPVADEEQLATPTLPSLRPEVTSTLSVSSQVETDTKHAGTPVIEIVSDDVIADRTLTAVEQSSAVLGSALEVSSANTVLDDVASKPPTDGAASVSDLPSDEIPLVLPSLVSSPKRATEAATTVEDHNLSGQQTGTRKAFTQSSATVAVTAVSESGRQVLVPPPVVAASVAQQNVVADTTQTADSASRLGENVNGQSKNTAAQNPAAVSPDESNVSKLANNVNRRATANSDSSTNVEKTAASSSGEIDNGQLATRQAVAERAVAGSTVSTTTEQGESSDPAEVEQVSAATPSEDAINDRKDAHEAIVNSGLNASTATTHRRSDSIDRQSLQNVEASVASANPVVVKSVQAESPADSQSERASIPTAEPSKPKSRKGSTNASPNQKAANSGDISQSNRERPAVGDRGIAETSAQASPQDSGEQSSAGVSIAASSDQLAAGAQTGPAAPTAFERVAVVPRPGNDSQTSTVGNASAIPVSQVRQPVSPVVIQSAAVINTSGDATVASPVPASEVGSVSLPSAPVEVQTSDVAAVSNVQATSTTAATSTASTRSDVVREPAVPIEIQDAVSAIQEATSGDSHIRGRLNPRELGNMLVDVSRTEKGVVARLEVESAAARVAILETLPDLQQSLSRSGSSVDRVEVVLTETRAESGRQESDQSQPREQQSRQERQSSNQQARDEQNERREQNQRRDQREDGSSVVEESSEGEISEQLDIKL